MNLNCVNKLNLISTSILSLVVSILCFYYFPRINEANYVDSDKLLEIKESCNLFIGITSSPDHVQHRQSLRDTWLQLLPNSFKYRFLIGKKMCNIPPLDRTSLYSCDSLNFEIPKYATEATVISANSLDSTFNNETFEVGIGFTFHIHHPILIQSLGIKMNTKLSDEGLARVVITDLSSSYKISSVTFDRDSLKKHSGGKGYVFKKLKNPVLLPKDFEGSIKIEGLGEDSEKISCREFAKWSHGNVFSVVNIITGHTTLQPNSRCILSTFTFAIRDLDHLRSLINGRQRRMAEWSLNTQKVSELLQQEVVKHKDILLLDMVDVYRNLPQKMLLFIKWVYEYHNVKYVLKTDDDIFIDILTIKVELDKTSEWDWWSCFRIGWPVQKQGKWRETTYQQDTYPTFPSGAGYILSKRAVTWLNNRIDNLSTAYQGEDVAIGIWLEALGANRHVGEACYWACNEQCHIQACNVMQLTVQDVYRVWGDYKKCGNKICC